MNTEDNNIDDNIFCEEAVFLLDNDENIIITTSPSVCSSLTKTTNNLVTDYVDEEREGIEFISDVNIVDGEPMAVVLVLVVYILAIDHGEGHCYIEMWCRGCREDNRRKVWELKENMWIDCLEEAEHLSYLIFCIQVYQKG